jgi:hypothetical protein
MQEAGVVTLLILGACASTVQLWKPALFIGLSAEWVEEAS